MSKASRVLLVPLERPDRSELRVQPARRVTREILARPALSVRPDPREDLQARPEPPAL